MLLGETKSDRQALGMEADRVFGEINRPYLYPPNNFYISNRSQASIIFTSEAYPAKLAKLKNDKILNASVLQIGHTIADDMVVYAIMHRQEVFQPFKNHPRFHELLENMFIVLDFFSSRMDTYQVDGEWSVNKVLEVIIINSRSWRGERMKEEVGATPEPVPVGGDAHEVDIHSERLTLLRLIVAGQVPAGISALENYPQPQVHNQKVGEEKEFESLQQASIEHIVCQDMEV
ncbi:hypothetical protein KSP40_PGU001027 [Platanthera guangdongensis]|uniref:Dymeclin n=1 Tax=Platanthera guangdongensis TaxID=2320717 RepID=A0ABR2LKU3_9ASPA